MEESKKLFNLTTGKRYYHCVAIKHEGNISVKNIWSECGFKLSQNAENYSYDDNLVDHRRIISDIPYHGGDKDYSINQDNNSPYAYDVFLLELSKLNMLVICFPFKLLAENIIDRLIQSKNLLSRGKFAKIDINKLLKINHELDFVVTNSYYSYFIEIDLTLTGETDLSTIGLNGDQPLKSALYKKVFLNLVKNNDAQLEGCTLKTISHLKIKDNIPKTNSNIHMDLFGNFKIYLHASGNNVFTFPSLFHLLAKQKCIEYSLVNPIKHINDEQR